MASSSASNKEYILLNNLGSKYNLLMKFGHFMSCYERNISQPLLENEIVEPSFLY